VTLQVELLAGGGPGLGRVPHAQHLSARLSVRAAAAHVLRAAGGVLHLCGDRPTGVQGCQVITAVCRTVRCPSYTH